VATLSEVSSTQTIRRNFGDGSVLLPSDSRRLSTSGGEKTFAAAGSQLNRSVVVAQLW